MLQTKWQVKRSHLYEYDQVPSKVEICLKKSRVIIFSFLIKNDKYTLNWIAEVAITISENGKMTPGRSSGTLKRIVGDVSPLSHKASILGHPVSMLVFSNNKYFILIEKVNFV